MRPITKLIGLTVALSGSLWTVTSCGNSTTTAANQRNDSLVATQQGAGSSANVSSNTSCLTGPQSLDLTAPASVGYTDTIQALLTKSCVSCHTSTGQAPDLSTYAAASAAATSSLNAINLGVMPPTGAMAAADTASFQAWVSGGMLQTATAAAPAAAPAAPAVPAAASPATNCPAPPAVAPTVVTTPSATPAATPAAGTTTVTAPSTSAATGTAAVTAPATTPASGTTTAVVQVTYANTVQTLMANKCVGCHGPGGQSPDLSTYSAASSHASASLSQIKSGLMPPSGKLDDATIAQFQSWVTNNEPQM